MHLLHIVASKGNSFHHFLTSIRRIILLKITASYCSIFKVMHLSNCGLISIPTYYLYTCITFCCKQSIECYCKNIKIFIGLSYYTQNNFEGNTTLSTFILFLKRHALHALFIVVIYSLLFFLFNRYKIFFFLNNNKSQVLRNLLYNVIQAVALYRVSMVQGIAYSIYSNYSRCTSMEWANILTYQ